MSDNKTNLNESEVEETTETDAIDEIIERDTCENEQVTEEDRDEDVEDFSKRFKHVYESQFREYLKQLKKGENLNATSFPTKKYNKLTYEEDSANSTTLVFFFEALDCDENGNINAVIAKSFDKAEICYFVPHLCKQYGPYYQTKLYCSIGKDKGLQPKNNSFLKISFI